MSPLNELASPHIASGLLEHLFADVHPDAVKPVCQILQMLPGPTSNVKQRVPWGGFVSFNELLHYAGLPLIVLPPVDEVVVLCQLPVL